MRSEQSWRPTKFVKTSKGLRASRDRQQVAYGSRFIADIIAACYEEALKQHASGHLLDLGCGRVPLYGAYRDLVQEVTCVDWENTLHQSPHLDLTANLNEHIPLGDSAYDTILLTDVLEHIMEPELLMSEISRMLRPGGKVIIGVPFFYWIHEAPYDFHRYTEYALRRHCEQNQLQVVRLEPYGGLPDIMLDITAKMCGSLPRSLTQVAGAVHNACSQTLRNTTPYMNISKRTAKKYPLGYVLIAQLPERVQQ